MPFLFGSVNKMQSLKFVNGEPKTEWDSEVYGSLKFSPKSSNNNESSVRAL